MSELALISIFSIITAGLTVAIGSFGAAMGEGRVAAAAMSAMAQQPDASPTLSRTLFVSLAMIEASGIYCFVVGLILIFANPFWDAARLVSGS